MTIVDIEIGNMCSFFSEITSGIYIFRMEIKYLCIILSRSNIFVFQIDFEIYNPKKNSLHSAFFIGSRCLLASLFVGLLNMISVEEIFSRAQFSFGGGVTHSKFSLHNVSSSYNMVYSKLLIFFCVEWTIQKSSMVSCIPEILPSKEKQKHLEPLKSLGLQTDMFRTHHN